MRFLLALLVCQSIVLSGAQVCDRDNPTAAITSPSTGGVGGVSVAVEVTATDATSGVASVTVYWEYCGASFTGCTGAKTALTPDTTSPYSVTWTFPSCGAAPLDRFRIYAQSKDTCGNESAYAAVDVRLTGRGC